MNYRPLGTSGIDASSVAFGAWAIGGWMWGGTDERQAIDAIRAALDAGINFLDTAPIYGFGISEEIVGKAIAGRRDEVVLATKCGLVWDGARGSHFFDSDPGNIRSSGDLHVYRHLGPKSIRQEVERSLQRLGTDVIDLYQTHWQDDTTPIADTMGELLALKEEGKIRAIGVSNATPEQMVEYAAVGPLDCDQEKYSMLDRAKESTNLPVCADRNLAFLAYSPLAQGLLTGKVGPARVFAEDDQRREKKRFSVENRVRVATMLDAMSQIAADHAINLAQLTIAWTVSQHGCTHALVGARTPEQARENAQGGTVLLAEHELARMNEIVRQHTTEIV